MSEPPWRRAEQSAVVSVMMQGNAINRLLIFLGLVGIMGLVPPPSSRAEEQTGPATRNVVARVNGKPIYEERLQHEVEKGLKKFRKYGLRNESPNLVERLQSRALDKMISEELIFQESQRLTIEGIDDKVEQKLADLARKHATRERFEKYLKQNNLTMESLRASLRVRLYVDTYLKAKGISEPQVADERVREEYERNPSSYSREGSVEVSHILIAVDGNAEAEDKRRALQEAEKIHKEILEGRDFAEMAREHSDCNSASGGGSLGYIKKGYMPEEFDAVAFAMEENSVSDVVKTRFGYHIIQVSGVKQAGLTPYVEVRDIIKRRLQEQESQKKLVAHVAELRTKARIEIIEQTDPQGKGKGP